MTAIVLTLNECSRIETCLKSLVDFNQVIIVDSLSTDGTLERARELWLQWGCAPERLTLVSRKWPGYTQARNESIQWAKEDWIFWVDADEWLSPELLKDLNSRNWSQHNQTLKVQRQSYFLNKAVKHSGWFPDHKSRLAPTKLALWSSGPRSSDVHEDLYLKDTEESDSKSNEQHSSLCNGFLYHEPFRDLKEQRDTNQHYSSLLARGLAENWVARNKSAPSNAYIFIKTGIKLLENFIFKRGFLDGSVGWKIACGSALSMKWRLEKAKKLLLENSKKSAEKKFV